MLQRVTHQKYWRYTLLLFPAINGLLSMLIYGVDYFPLFASLAMDSVAGYVIGTCYAWMLFTINIYKDTECELVYVSMSLVQCR